MEVVDHSATASFNKILADRKGASKSALCNTAFCIDFKKEDFPPFFCFCW